MKYRRNFFPSVITALLVTLLLSSCGDETKSSVAPPDGDGGAEKTHSIKEPIQAPKAAPVTAQTPPKTSALQSMPPPEVAMSSAPDDMRVNPSIVGSVRPTKKIGNILYNPPTEMTLNVTETIEVRIAKNEVSEKDLTGSGTIQKETIPISQTMSVRLCCGDSEKGDAFDIHSSSVEQQLVDSTLLEEDEFTEWVFQVTPRKPGDQQLQLFVSAHYELSNGKNIIKDEVLKRAIKVQVDTTEETKNWISENWYWLGLLLVIPLAALLISRRTKAEKFHPGLSGHESIFISYRRNDSSGYTLAIYEKLKTALGGEKVFMDMDDIPHGENFAKHIEKVLSKADTVLVMIGQTWLDASNAQGRRLDQPDDFVRMEIATALAKDLRVIPVLLRGAEMPTPESLPEDLQDLCMRNAIRIHDDQFDASIQRLIQSISH